MEAKQSMNKTLSRHNILKQIHRQEDWIVVNLLHRQAGIISPELASKIRDGSILSEPESDDYRELSEKGYIIDPERETSLYRLAYADFIRERDAGEVQVFYVPGYACNFACDYCYQDGYIHDSHQAQDDVIDAFFTHLDTHLAGKPWYLTVFGGEPLLPGGGQRKIISRLIEGANARNVEIALVTNGYYLSEYIDLLSTAKIREIQVTLDGVGDVHDRRRPLKAGRMNGGEYRNFEKVVRGIDDALAAGLEINLRSVLDRDNLPRLHELADFALKRGWTANPRFKTQLGRNYELHYCQDQQNRLYGRLEMYEDLFEQIQRYPQILEFHTPAYSISRFLFENGELPAPLFDSCPGTKTEWAYDYTGQIYSCTATVGKDGEQLGRFYPHTDLDHDRIADWEDRDVLSISACRDCSLQLACGGGCGSVAYNREGNLHAPDCRPVDGLISMGVALYQDADIHERTEEKRKDPKENLHFNEVQLQ